MGVFLATFSLKFPPTHTFMVYNRGFSTLTDDQPMSDKATPHEVDLRFGGLLSNGAGGPGREAKMRTIARDAAPHLQA